MRQVLMVGTIVLAVGFSAAACGDDNGAGGATPGVTPPANNTPAASAGFPVTVERSDGQALTLESAPQRMVVLSPGHVESLFAIGASDQIIAVDENANYPPEAAALQTKLNGFEPSVEAIAAEDPDLVILSYDADGIVGALDDLNIPVFYDDINTEITTIDGVFDSVLELGRITGHNDEARSLVGTLQARVEEVSVAVAAIDEGPRYYHELDENFFSIGDGSFINDLYTTLKAQNIAQASEGPYPQLTQEAIIDRNPEVIVLADESFGQTPQLVAARPGWDAIDAVQNGRIYGVDPDVFSRPGPRIVDALEELAGLLYPDLFPKETSARCLACSAVPA
ncbi:MAG: ABC transporter substrate-binding protein [Dehalococcoidia bacterium]